MPPITLHMVAAQDWERREGDRYRPSSVESEGFIHCTDDRSELCAVADRYYRSDPRDYVILEIDLERVTVPWRYDADPRYPHIYGTLNTDAVVAVRPFPRATDGSFLPDDAGDW